MQVKIGVGGILIDFNLSISAIENGLVIDNTTHKVTSKRQKTDEKSTHFTVQVSPSIFGFLKY